jgi:hypothetical protein
MNEKRTKRFRLRSDVWDRIVRKNLSQNEFARQNKFPSGYLSQLLSGTRCAGPKTRSKLLAALPEAGFDGLFEEVR